MLSLILLAALALPPAPGPGGPVAGDHARYGGPPEQGLAAIDARGELTFLSVKAVCGYGPSSEEVPLEVPGDKRGGKSPKAKVATMLLTVATLPAGKVEAYTADGTRIPAAKLAQLLAGERAVLFARDGKKVDAFHLSVYKEDTIILVPQANLWGTVAPPPPKGPPPKGGAKDARTRPPPKEARGNRNKERLTLVAAELPAAGAAATSAGDNKQDVPRARSLGNVAAARRLLDRLPRNEAPGLTEVTMKDGALVVARPAVFQELRQERVVVKRDGRSVELVRTVAVPFTVFMGSFRSVKAEAVKAFVVTKEGKLQPLEAARLADRFKEPTRVLIGNSPDLDPRHLELIRPGTIYLAVAW